MQIRPRRRLPRRLAHPHILSARRLARIWEHHRRDSRRAACQPDLSRSHVRDHRELELGSGRANLWDRRRVERRFSRTVHNHVIDLTPRRLAHHDELHEPGAARRGDVERLADENPPSDALQRRAFPQRRGREGRRTSTGRRKSKRRLRGRQHAVRKRQEKHPSVRGDAAREEKNGLPAVRPRAKQGRLGVTLGLAVGSKLVDVALKRKDVDLIGPDERQELVE